MLSIKLFPAEYGDCIMLSIGKHHQYNILIDGGLSKTYQKYIKSEIQHIKEMRQKIGLIVCTHMDNDHIEKKCLSQAKKYKLYKSSINKSLHFAQRSLSSSTRVQVQRITAQLNLSRE